jgi:Concanavalin A-like lectin/glucanases superfamily
MGKIGQALSFNGANNYVDVGTSLDQNNEITITAWIKANTVAAGQIHILANGDCGGITRGDYDLELNRTAGKLDGRWANTTVVTGNTSVTVGTWYQWQWCDQAVQATGLARFISMAEMTGRLEQPQLQVVRLTLHKLALIRVVHSSDSTAPLMTCVSTTAPSLLAKSTSSIKWAAS